MLSDLRFAFRLLWKDRTFAATALLTLAITIGANTAIFSIVRSVLLKPLPVPDSERIVFVYNSYPNAGAPRAEAAVPDYFDRLRERDGVRRAGAVSAAGHDAWRRPGAAADSRRARDAVVLPPGPGRAASRPALHRSGRRGRDRSARSSCRTISGGASLAATRRPSDATSG